LPSREQRQPSPSGRCASSENSCDGLRAAFEHCPKCGRGISIKSVEDLDQGQKSEGSCGNSRLMELFNRVDQNSPEEIAFGHWDPALDLPPAGRMETELSRSFPGQQLRPSFEWTVAS